MNINIVCVGRLKEDYWRDACAEYAKRIGAYANFKVIEVAEARLSDKPGEKEISLSLDVEAKLMQPYLNQRSTFNIAMCIEGKQLSSVELAETIEQAAVRGYGTINFIIGSSFGLAESVKRCSNLCLSISKMTLPHQLARVVVSEQIYRALSINNNGKYHK